MRAQFETTWRWYQASVTSMHKPPVFAFEGERSTPSIRVRTESDLPVRRAQKPKAQPVRILVVEDELPMRRLLQQIVESVGYSSVGVSTVHDALAELERQTYDLVLLDVMLPDGDGFACCRRIRARHRMPIIMISTKTAVADRIAGLGTGADDYIAKPFDPAEVIARVQAHLRRVRELAEDVTSVVRVGRLVIDPWQQDALIDGRTLGLTHKEFQLLQLLALRAGRAVSHDYLLEALWADDVRASENSLAVYIRRLRKKIETCPDRPEILLTVRGFGYKIAVPE